METMPSPHHNIASPVVLSPAEETPLGCSFVSRDNELTPSHVTPPANSESFLKPPSILQRRESSPKPSQRVLVHELISAQLDIDDVPDNDGFFLAAPKDVFPKQANVSSDSLVQPRAHHVDQFHDEEPMSSSYALASPTFRTIDEQDDIWGVRANDHDGLTPLIALVTPRDVRLKPRPASLQDGQRAWESMPCFSYIFGEGEDVED